MESRAWGTVALISACFCCLAALAEVRLHPQTASPAPYCTTERENQRTSAQRTIQTAFTPLLTHRGCTWYGKCLFHSSHCSLLLYPVSHCSIKHRNGFRRRLHPLEQEQAACTEEMFLIYQEVVYQHQCFLHIIITGHQEFHWLTDDHRVQIIQVSCIVLYLKASPHKQISVLWMLKYIIFIAFVSVSITSPQAMKPLQRWPTFIMFLMGVHRNISLLIEKRRQNRPCYIGDI